jgi:hypothetical protein
LLELAAASAPEILTFIFKSTLYLKPQWLDYTFLFSGPREILDDSESPIPTDEDNGWFDRTLVAYCMAYNVRMKHVNAKWPWLILVQCNPTRLRYTVDLEVEDAPQFKLLSPEGSRDYSVLELLAVFRALRFNESFRSISFQDVSLQCLHGLIDSYGKDHVAWASRGGVGLSKFLQIEPNGKSLLYQECQALALKAMRLRRLDFSNTLPKRRPRDNFDEEGRAEKDPGCEIIAAIMPLCRGQLTNVDWIVLNGIELGETDLEELGKHTLASMI